MPSWRTRSSRPNFGRFFVMQQCTPALGFLSGSVRTGTDVSFKHNWRRESLTGWGVFDDFFEGDFDDGVFEGGMLSACCSEHPLLVSLTEMGSRYIGYVSYSLVVACT
jgi:hypothetical protein